MAEETPNTVPEKPKSKSPLKPLLIFGLGCFVLLVILGTALSVAGGFLAKKAGFSVLSNFIENKTGIKTNLQGVEEGKLTFTDKETGAQVDVGSGKLPVNFPKDFPLYPGAVVAGSLSGSEEGKKTGFWITFSTDDSFDKVSAWYKTNLKSGGWTTKSTYETGESVIWNVTKGTLEGTVTVAGASEDKDNKTTIAVMLGESEDKTVTPEPVEESGEPEISPTEAAESDGSL